MEGVLAPWHLFHIVALFEIRQADRARAKLKLLLLLLAGCGRARTCRAEAAICILVLFTAQQARFQARGVEGVGRHLALFIDFDFFACIEFHRFHLVLH